MTTAIWVGLLAVVCFAVPGLIMAWQLRKPVRATPADLDPYKDPQYRAALISVIDDARREIIMVRGEIPPSVYNEEVADALKRAHNRGVNIKVVCGPEVNVRVNGTHPVLDLAKEGVLEIYYSRRNQQLHFVEADETRAYLEKEHPQGARSRRVWDIEHSNFVGRNLRHDVQAAIKTKAIERVSSIKEKFTITRGVEGNVG